MAIYILHTILLILSVVSFIIGIAYMISYYKKNILRKSFYKIIGYSFLALGFLFFLVHIELVYSTSKNGNIYDVL